MQEMKNSDVTSILVNDLLKEKRADRRWKNVRFIAWFALIVYLAINIFRFMNGGPVSSIETGHRKYTALIRLDGMIAPGRDFSSDTIVPILREAFADKNAVGVIIDITHQAAHRYKLLLSMTPF